jgi:flagellar hook-associated protein 1 FlgK
MSIFSTLGSAANALSAAQIGLQVTGNNIANANTPGYVRENVQLAPAPTQRYGNLLLGTGVDVHAIVQQTDRFLEERLRNASSDLAGSETQEDAYVQLESIFGELTDTDLSSSLSNFFNSIHDILNQPDSASVRNLAVLQGKTLTDVFHQLDGRVRAVRADVNKQVAGAADEINSLLGQVANLNVQIVTAEGGKTSPSDAVGLRDRRSLALDSLGKLIDIRAVEQTTGDVTVFAGGDYLVFQGTYRPVEIQQHEDRGQLVSEIRITDSDAQIASSSGKLAGLITSRDTILGGFLDNLDGYAKTLIGEFNKVYSGGQGLTGYNSLTSEFAVNDPAAALDQAGLKFTPTNGLFQVHVHNDQTGLTSTTDIRVNLNGLDDDVSLSGLAAQLDAVDGISATISPEGKLQIKSDAPQTSFSFADDTSGTLAALGLNTFFTGSRASDIDISALVKADSTKFAASSGGVGEDTGTAVQLADLLRTPLAAQKGASLSTLYDRLAGDVTQGAAITHSVAEGFRTFQKTLEGQYLGVTGVNIDEEAVKLIAYQRAFQASARVISTLDKLLETLINL